LQCADAQDKGNQVKRTISESVILSFAPLGLSQELEEELTDMLLVQTRGILRLFQESDDTVETLAGLVRRLETVLNQT
jgi:hypothetical protein